ncbi:hypothetical protein [Winogradskyella haliclonae]|uniref:Uncharacterized protein n=1 Tax=Winogradskyella haliclonae TaxID=2048558 RepID=A0ABQ2BX36_9FLAO|nr:hypothetical protein [Winogradskyella haliclonae]GGI57010.1 hypothetical protein GCM10011444_13190 [Winogradskyella haliclonae]
MINLKDYYKNFKANNELFEILRERRFKKTEMDVVYDDFVRWEKNGLLWSEFEDKHHHRKYSYVYYTWVKLVEQLRQFGFDYQIIKTFKCSLSETFDNDFYKLAIEEKRELLLEYCSEEELNRFNDEIENEVEEENPITAFESFILNVINHNDIVSLLFFHNKPHFYVPISGEILKEFELRPEASEYFEYLKESHVSISINEITRSFINNDIPSDIRSEKFTSILTEQEHNALKLIRKDYKNLKSVLITTKDDQLNMIELETVKKANAESMFIHHFKKGDYKSMHITTVDGKVVYITDNEKHKL